ncbi:MAG TPA: class I SAM-dependent methyltransferase [Anaerolineae bacterium]|nr:class I SAM-dependent methyltransferase [Anaerolineae bacterium]
MTQPVPPPLTDHRSPAWWNERYRQQDAPWDTGVVPPELHELVDTGQLRPPGVTLDLGCGTGTNVNFLASLGFTAIGIDLAWRAVAEARRKALAASLPARFFAGDVADLALDHVQACFALDMGCLHSLSEENRERYARSLARLVGLGGFYMLYGFDQDPTAGEGSRGFGPGEIAVRFAPHFRLLWQRPSWQGDRPVAWYLLERR